jgi:hypothetical protein
MAANLLVLIGEKGAGGIVAAGDNAHSPRLFPRGASSMDPSIFSARFARQRPTAAEVLPRGIAKTVFRLARYWLFGLLILVVGCGKNPRAAEHTEVSGQVLFQGQPLQGGRVTFVAVNGGFASSGTIDKNGNYQINAPVGEVEIGVTNRMLKPRTGKAPLRPQKAGAKEDQPLEGRWVSIPPHYEDPHTSGLRYTVKSGPQTHSIELSASSSPAPGASGS